MELLSSKKRWSAMLIVLSVTTLGIYYGGPVQQVEVEIRQHTSKSNMDMCDVRCTTGTPCSYLDEVDLRIIVITFNRPGSLTECLEHVYRLDTLGDRVSVDIWVDVNSKGQVDNRTISVSRQFAKTWKKGRVCVHQQTKSALIGGQWIDTWRPKPHTTELGLILEDDIDISPQAYRWLKMVRKRFKHYPDISGYALQTENIKVVEGKLRSLTPPKSEIVFLYAQFMTWGFAPDPDFWRQFQDWYHDQTKEPDFRPYVPKIISTSWFKTFRNKHKEKGMWSMWFTYFCYVHNRFTVLSNLHKFTGRVDVALEVNRREAGLHFNGKTTVKKDHTLLTLWDSKFENISDHVLRYKFDGTVVKT